MTYVRVDKNTYVSVCREADPEDEYDQEDISHYVEILGIEEVGESDFFDFTVPFSLEADKEYWLVYGVYDTGDSFHREDGVHEMIDLYTSKERAEATAGTFQRHYLKYKDSLNHLTNYNYVDKQDTTFNCHYERDDGSVISFSVPWTGYFERLQDVYCERVQIINK